MALTREQILESINRNKALIAAAKEKKLATEAAAEQARKDSMKLQYAAPLPTSVQSAASLTPGIEWNVEQQTAIDNTFYGKSLCLIGAAGTGKTTTLKGGLRAVIDGHRLPMLEASTRYLASGTPGVALISYTRRAVRNIAKQMPPDLKDHCITFHKLVEYAPEKYWDKNDEGETVEKTRFAPTRHRANPLPRNLRLIIVDEASMLSIDYFNQLLDALPYPSQVQFIFLGDLNQLPPVYGQAILGKMLLRLPIVELTRVYRQALESPIIALALAVKDNNFAGFLEECADGTFEVNGERLNKAVTTDIAKRPTVARQATKTVISRPGRGKVTLHPWKKVLDKDDALEAMQGQLRNWIKDGTYDPDQDLVLCPWVVSFGTDELNRSIADFIAKSKGLEVHEVIAGFNKHYFAVGDKLLIDKMEAQIINITRNPKYLGKHPQKASTKLNRWGEGGSGASFADEDITDEQIDFMLEHASIVEDRTAQCSHVIRVLFLDTDSEEDITQSALINGSSFAYAITVHKAQGSECRRVFFLTHTCHAAMCSRELVYTAITRAAEELYIVMPPDMLGKSASKPRIKGDTLSAKLEYFASRLDEKADGAS